MKKGSKTTTAEALLGMLTLGPMSGYDLKQRIERSIGNFWSESYGQIYPTLKRLEEEGFVGSRKEGKAGRLVYSITAAGQDRLRAWLEVGPRPKVNRSELLLKLFFGRMAPVESMREHVLATRARYAADLVRYEGLGPTISALHQGKPGLPFYRMAVSYGVREARMILEWCDETLEALDGVEAGSEVGRDEHRGHGVGTEQHGEERVPVGVGYEKAD
jgi:PadR family transcriptional regulator AphA